MTRALALITGAASGIGRAYARRLASAHDFVLVDLRAEPLADVADELRQAGAAVESLAADLSTQDGIAKVTGRLAKGDVRLLISNAGAGGYARLADVAPEDVAPVLTLNGVAHIQLVHAALPGMLAADAGTIVTVASLLAFSAAQTNEGIPHRTLYAAAKASLVAFTRTLAVELAGTNIRTQVLCPSVVATEFNHGAGFDAPIAMTAEDVAQAGLTGLSLGETVCIPGLEDQAAVLEAFAAAETAVLNGGFRPALAARYRQPEEASDR
ncbi:SDR family NAD(P)-dependent oxidoreductase [Streptomyces sp. NPDC048278]|uniref:SDR family NAD(P)-dependent oxidoreductase n=1 Tax=Streptomyces sp. NPDC048278 TaxID=3155809 RepID=UPI00341ECE2D